MSRSEFKKYLSYFIQINKISLLKLTAYRTNFGTMIMGTYGYTIVVLIFLNAVFSQITEIGGWNKHEIMIMFGVGQLLYYIYWSFIGGGSNFLNRIILSGEYDKFLLKPLNSIYTVSLETSNFFELTPSIMLGLAIIIYNLIQLGILGNWILFIPLFILSVAIYYFMFLNLTLLSFWFDDTRDIMDTFDNLFELTNYPPTVYPAVFKVIFLTIIPLGIVAYVPTYNLVKGVNFNLIIIQIFALALMLGICTLLWGGGIKNYSSASS